MLRVALPAGEKVADVNVARPAARRRVGLVPDEHVPIGRIANEKPSVAVGASIQFCRFLHDRRPTTAVSELTPCLAHPFAFGGGSFMRIAFTMRTRKGLAKQFSDPCQPVSCASQPGSPQPPVQQRR